MSSAEKTLPTPHPKLRIAQVRAPENPALLEDVLGWLARSDGTDVRERLRAWVPEYGTGA